MVCKSWNWVQHLERINMCYVYIRFGSQVDKGIAWGLSPIKNFTPPPTPVGNLGYHFESVDSQRPWPPWALGSLALLSQLHFSDFPYRCRCSMALPWPRYLLSSRWLRANGLLLQTVALILTILLNWRLFAMFFIWCFLCVGLPHIYNRHCGFGKLPTLPSAPLKWSSFAPLKPHSYLTMKGHRDL